MFSDFLRELEQAQRAGEVTTDEADSTIKKRPPPPSSCEQWLARDFPTGQWPPYTPTEGLLGPQDHESVLGSLEDIKSDLRRHSTWDSAFLDDIDYRLLQVEGTLGYYASCFICEPAPTSKESISGGLSYFRVFPTEIREKDLMSLPRLRSRGEQLAKLDDSDNKTAESAIFPGFLGGKCAVVPLPAKLEPLPLLVLVTNAQKHPPHLKKYWRMMFYSDWSSCILQSAFWWMWMDYFKPDRDLQSRLFDNMSEQFVGLLRCMGDKHKDQVFTIYPGCLAQALYSTFCHAFPNSHKTVNSEGFLSFLASLTSEWIAGVPSPPRCWKTWPRHTLDPHHSAHHTATPTRATTASLTERDVMVFSPSRHEPSPSRQISRVQFRQNSSPTHPRHSTRSGRREAVEEESIGPGPTYECVQFAMLARSPLLQHYMVGHGLAEAGSSDRGPTVSRIQVKDFPPTTMTYKELLEKVDSNSKAKYDSYDKQTALASQELAHSQRCRAVSLRRLERDNQRLLQHKYEVAILAEKLMNSRRSRPAHGPRARGPAMQPQARGQSRPATQPRAGDHQ